MIRLNRLTDYAVVVLTRMANAPDEVQTAPQLADGSTVPLPTVAKLLKMLTRDGIVTSQRGASGGYVLSRAPEAITVKEIIRAMEGPISLTSCVDGATGGCEVESLCPMRGNWDKVNTAIREALEGVTLSDMSAPLFSIPVARPCAASSGTGAAQTGSA